MNHGSSSSSANQATWENLAVLVYPVRKSDDAYDEGAKLSDSRGEGRGADYSVKLITSVI